MSAALPDLLGPTGCDAAPDLLGFDDVVRVVVVATESAPATAAAPGVVYEGAADVHSDPKGLDGSPAGDGERAANAVVFLEGEPRDGFVPEGAVFAWVLDRTGRDPESAGHVVGTRPDGSLLVHLR